jgi:NADH-quinone oxidoreductase subunit G
MPIIVIDHQKIEVPSGTKVIEAAECLGIMIPRFCYHPALGSVGACRVCAVSFQEGPVKGIQMSCMVEVKDGMVVSTADPEVLDFRKHVIEWLMANHPHDCPVCDEGGHCLLQDMTVAGGHGIRRYPGLKRTFNDQYLGPLIQQEMNRCIHCYRCVRYYRELTGYTDFGTLRIGNRISYGRFHDGALESPFAGNLIDLCPTGVFTDKPSRFTGRRWEYERQPSLCIHCSLGCHTTVNSRYREIVRQESRFSASVNGHFICDRGRYGFYYANLESRPRQATVDGKPVFWNQACRTVFERLKVIEKRAAGAAVGCLGSVRSSIETQAMLLRLCRLKRWKEPTFFIDPGLESRVRTAVTRLTPDVSVSLAEVTSSDIIVVVGADPINEAPMLAHEMRRAQTKGAEIFVMDPRPIFLPFQFNHAPVDRDLLAPVLGKLIQAVGTHDAAESLGDTARRFLSASEESAEGLQPFESWISELSSKIKRSACPLIVCGTGITPRTIPGLAADFTQLLREMKKQAGLFYLLSAANAFSAGLFPGEDSGFEKILEGIESGKIKALIVVENDPFLHFRDAQRLSRALDRLDLLVVLDFISSRIVKKAHIVIPTETLYEAGGLFINNEGRAQLAHPVYRGGVPLLQTGSGGHPPRDYTAGAGSGDSLPAWLALACLADREQEPERDGSRRDIIKWLREAVPGIPPLPSVESFPEEGISILPDAAPGQNRFQSEWPGFPMKDKTDETLILVPVSSTFGTVDLSILSPCLRSFGDGPSIFIHSSDAKKWTLSDGDRVALNLESGTLEVTTHVRENMASGVVIMPRHRRLVNGPVKRILLNRKQIEKIV